MRPCEAATRSVPILRGSTAMMRLRLTYWEPQRDGTRMARIWQTSSTSARIVIGVVLVFAALGFLLGRADRGNPWPIALILGLFGLLLAAALVNAWHESQPFVLERHVPLGTDELHDYAAQWFGQAPWHLAQVEPDRLAWWRRTEPRVGVFVVLLLFGILPGVLYFLWARHEQTVTIAPCLNDGRNRVVDFYNALVDLVSEPPESEGTPFLV